MFPGFSTFLYDYLLHDHVFVLILTKIYNNLLCNNENIYLVSVYTDNGIYMRFCILKWKFLSDLYSDFILCGCFSLQGLTCKFNDTVFSVLKS